MLTPLKYGTVTGRFLAAVGDTSVDTDLNPDGVPMQGRVTFTPQATAVLVSAAVPVPATVLPATVVCGLDAEGYLVYPETGTTRSVTLLATDDPAMNPTGWAYTVQFSLTLAGNLISYPAYNIQVPADQTTDLTLTARVPSAPGTGITRGVGVVDAVSVAGDLVLTLSDGTTTAPVPLPAGPVGPATTDASLLATGTVADARLPARLGEAALDGRIAKVANPYPAFMRLKAVLAEAKASTGINIVTDSTGNTAGRTRWPFLFTPWLADQYPNHAVQMLTWNNDTARYDAPVVIQGTPHARYSTFHGVAGSDHYGDGTVLTGDIDVRIKVTFPNWSAGPGGNMTLAGRWGMAGQKGWYLQMRSYGQMLFGWSADGTNAAGFKESSAIAVTAGAPIWLRATLTVATGNVAFYTALDTGTAAHPTSWITAGGGFGIGGVSTATSISNPGSSWPYEVGADSNGVSNKFTGDIYEVEIRNGIDAPSVVPRYPDNWTSHNGTTTNAVTHKGSPVITILNGAAPGAALSYFTVTANLNKMTTPAYCSDVFILSEGHNEGWTTGWPYIEKLDTWINAIRAKTKRAEIVWTTQNPKSGVALYIEPHTDRRRDQLTWATKQDLSIIDVYREFLDSPKGMAVLNEPDGTHPSDLDGSPLWASIIQDAFAQSP